MYKKLKKKIKNNSKKSEKNQNGQLPDWISPDDSLKPSPFKIEN